MVMHLSIIIFKKLNFYFIIDDIVYYYDYHHGPTYF